MKRGVGLIALLSFFVHSHAQVDTTFIYKTGMPYGTLDIRLAKSATRYYYLQENKTFSFRESAPGVRTNSYRDLTSWDSSPYTQGNLREKNGSSDAFIMNYRLLYPVNYNAAYNPGYPLIIFIHGAGERGNCWDNSCYHGDRNWRPSTNTPAAPVDQNSRLLNNDHNLLHGGKPHLDMRNNAGSKLPNDPTLPARSFPGFVLFPQNMNGWDPNSIQDVIRLVRLVAKKYNVDENRIYIEGLSNGGYGVYECIKRAPWLFASAITMSAISEAGIIGQNLTSKIAHIPLWTFQGGRDSNPTPSKTQGYVKRFREAGAIVKYTLYPEFSHGTWNKAMSEPDFFRWMLSQSKTNIHVFAGSSAICLTNGAGVKMQLAEGFRAYQWERNGVIISGATAATYEAKTTGVYRARFSRKANPGASDWNPWSPPVTVTESNPSQVQVDQIGTLHLKDLNFFGDAKLKAPSGFARYHWYKDGVKLNLSDTVSRPTFKSGDCSTGPCVGNGAYTLVTSQFDNCPSPPSNPKNIFFNNQSPVNVAAPTNFTGNVPNASTVRLTWTDASTNEVGFEIWRRKRLTATTYGKWEMRTITNPNVTSFNDTSIEPATTYQYKMRAAGASGRSDYTPAASNAFVTVTTSGDATPPSTPQNVTAALVGINTIELKWQPSTDNSGIKQYRIYYGSETIQTNNNKTTYRLTNLTLNTNYSFTIRAEDLGGNLSSPSTAVNGSTYMNGLFYEHSTGAWTDLDNINWTAPPEYTGTVTTFSLAPRRQEDYFNFEFDGYVYINTSGTYFFQTISSDGSRLTLDDVVLVNNDGVHGSITITSQGVALTAGPKRINVKYFELDESHVLTVRYRGPDTNNSFISIPASALKSGDPGTALAMASVEEAEIVQSSAASIFPNPASSRNINVQMQSESLAPVSVRIIDFSGKPVYEQQFSGQDANSGVVLPIGYDIPNGLYIIEIQQDDYLLKERLWIRN